MKKIIGIVLLTLFISVSIAQAEVRTTKINDHKVIVETYYYADKLGKEEVVVETVEYGDNQLLTLIENAQAKLTSAKAIDATTYKQKQIDGAQTDLDKYQALLDVMNGVVE